MTIKIKNLNWGQHWSIVTFDGSTTQEFYMKEISSMDYPQQGEVFYFYGQALQTEIRNVPEIDCKKFTSLFRKARLIDGLCCICSN
jgi:hypothetical protein